MFTCVCLVVVDYLCWLLLVLLLFLRGCLICLLIVLVDCCLALYLIRLVWLVVGSCLLIGLIAVLIVLVMIRHCFLLHFGCFVIDCLYGICGLLVSCISAGTLLVVVCGFVVVLLRFTVWLWFVCLARLPLLVICYLFVWVRLLLLVAIYVAIALRF